MINIIVTILLIIAGMLFIICFYRLRDKLIRFLKESVKTKGYITDLEDISEGSASGDVEFKYVFFKVKVKYYDKQNNEYENFVENYQSQKKHHIGKEITVFYEKENPKNFKAFIQNQIFFYNILIFVGFFLIIFATFFCLYHW